MLTNSTTSSIKTLKGNTMPDKNVFISHYGKDDEHIGKLKALLRSKNYTLKNSSIDSTKSNNASNPDYIRELLRKRVQWAGTAIILIGPKTHTRPWVNWEISQAAKYGKRIVGVFINGAKEAPLPEEFKKFGDALIGWNTDRIIEAIEGRITNWENEDGSQRTTKWSIDGGTC